VNVTFFENKSYFSASLGSTITPSIIHATLPVPLEDSPPLQVFQQRKKITTDLDSLSPHQLIEVSELPIALRKDTRSCTQHLITKLLSFSHLSPTYFSFTTTLSSLSFKSYRDAILDPEWKSNMDKKMIALHANETCELTSLPSEKQIIGCRWIYTIKFLSNGQIEHLKAQLVPKSYTNLLC